jgi:glycosyltransferase involved in cell wall biosynthesis
VRESAGVQWPKTDKPLRIAMLGWARLSAQAWEGSGYNLSASELARGLVMSGHKVFYLASGMTYRLVGGPRILHRETWGGIACFDLRNAPNLSPAASNFCNMDEEMSSPGHTDLVLRWLDDVGAQIIHIHSLEGYGLDLIAAIRRGRRLPGGGHGPSRSVVVTPHNYWYVCPQVDLLHQEKRVCLDYDGGRRCVDCLPRLDPRQVKRDRAIRQTLVEALGPGFPELLKQGRKELKAAWRRLLRGRLLERHNGKPVNPDRLVDPEVPLGFESVSGAAMRGETDGLILHDLPLEKDESPPVLEPAPEGANEALLKADHHLKVLNNYGRRRVAAIEGLNAASMVIPPSDFLRRAHVAMGLIESKTRWVRLGQPHFDQINRRARRSPYYERSPWDPRTATRPLRFGFYGTTRPNKGVEVLLQAIPLLKREVRQRCQFLIRALGWDWPMRKRLSMYPEVSFNGGYDLLQLISAGGEYDVGVLPHIWMENSPLVMLEHLHAGKFVIASDLGGPPDWIHPPENGLLFPAGRPDELADCITRIVQGEVRLPSPKEIHEATVLQSYPGHVREVEGVYQELLERASDVSAGARTGQRAALAQRT